MNTEESFTLPALNPSAVPARSGSICPTEKLRSLIGRRSKQALGAGLSGGFPAANPKGIL